VIAVDTNVLARFYVDDPDDPDARKQRPAAHDVMSGSSIFVPVTALFARRARKLGLQPEIEFAGELVSRKPDTMYHENAIARRRC